jgi:hypothetical protein
VRDGFGRPDEALSFDRNGDIVDAPFTLLRLAPDRTGMSDAGPDVADGTEPVAVVPA